MRRPLHFALSLLFFAPLVACGSSASDDATMLDGGGPDGTGQDATSGNDGAKNDGTTSDAKPDVTGTCGTCPQGYACGSANSMAVCRSTTTGIPLFTNVFVILMENTSLSTLETAIGGGQAPNLKGWQAAYATATDYHGVAHPSTPNYIALTCGNTQGIGCDCDATPGEGSCSPVLDVCFPACSCDQPTTVKNIGDQLDGVSKTWMDFGESMNTPCNLTDSGNYAVRHNPFLYYDDIQTPMSRCTAHCVDFSTFNPSSPANFNFIAPNLIDDMHSSSINAGDTWLGAHVPAILASSAYKNGGLLVIVWDEDDKSGGIGGTTDNPIGMFLFSPYAKSGGYMSSVKANHYSLLATFEDGLGVGRLQNAATASPLQDFFPAN